MLDIGRICIKTAGKDAGKKVVIVDAIDDNFVMIDGQVKRKRCNILHLEPTQMAIKLKKNSPHSEIVKEFKQLNMEIKETKPKTKKSPKPKQQRVKKEKIPAQAKEAKKEVKKLEIEDKKKPEIKEQSKSKKPKAKASKK